MCNFLNTSCCTKNLESLMLKTILKSLKNNSLITSQGHKEPEAYLRKPGAQGRAHPGHNASLSVGTRFIDNDCFFLPSLYFG